MLEALLGLLYEWILLKLFQIARFAWAFFRLPLWRRRLAVYLAANQFVTSVCEKTTDLVQQGKTDVSTAERVSTMAKWIIEKTRPLEIQTEADLKQLIATGQAGHAKPSPPA